MADHARDEALTSWQADDRQVTTGFAAVDRRAFLAVSLVLC